MYNNSIPFDLLVLDQRAAVTSRAPSHDVSQDFELLTLWQNVWIRGPQVREHLLSDGLVGRGIHVTDLAGATDDSPTVIPTRDGHYPRTVGVLPCDGDRALVSYQAELT